MTKAFVEFKYDFRFHSHHQEGLEWSMIFFFNILSFLSIRLINEIEKIIIISTLFSINLVAKILRQKIRIFLSDIGSDHHGIFCFIVSNSGHYSFKFWFIFVSA